jgi:molecular chaperone DnaK (HSP70)
MIAIGIDYGTGNTVLSYWRNNRITIAKFNGLDYISSDLLVNEDDKIELDPLLLDNPPSGYKRIRGIKRALLDLNEISSDELRRFANMASKRISFLYEYFVGQYENESYQSVLTCPAHASQAYRELLLDIGRSIGLNELEIIDEPTAAAVHHGLRKIPTEEERLLVIDWGCGTCDVSLIERQAGLSDLNVIAVTGNNRLGGMDMDDLLGDYLSSK